MQFRLVLRGALPPNKQGKANAKHRIRQELHPQLRVLWQQHPALAIKCRARPEAGETRPPVEDYADAYARCGFRFVPLVDSDTACALDILLLRRDQPNQLFFAGDIDGRVKTLLDGLRLPQQCSEVSGLSPTHDEDPFFVLMEDDRSIYEINVTTDRLLVPPEPNEPERDVVAVINVRTRSASGGSLLNIHDNYR